MATDDIPPFLRTDRAESVGTLTEHVLVYEVTTRDATWYAWCPVSLAQGVGFDLDRVRWSAYHPGFGPLAELLPKGEGPQLFPPAEELADKRPSQIRPSVWPRWSREPVFAYDAPYVLP